MDIKDVNHIKYRDIILDLIENVNGEYTRHQLLQWLVLNLGSDVFGAWVAFENDVPVGVITVEIVEPYDPKAYIAWNYVKPGVDVNKQLIALVENWAIKKGLHKLYYYTKRSPKTFIKKHGFRLIRSVLGKDI